MPLKLDYFDARAIAGLIQQSDPDYDGPIAVSLKVLASIHLEMSELYVAFWLNENFKTPLSQTFLHERLNS